MAGKITFREGEHSSRGGGWVTPVMLNTEHVSGLEGTLERVLTAAECQMIINTLTTIQGCREATSGNDVNHQDVIETLKAIAKADDIGVQQAFRDCDDTTESLIHDAIHSDMWIVEFSTEHPPERIRAAAKLALSSLNSGKGGSKVKGYRLLFAEAVLRLWHELGHQDNAIWEYAERASPLVRFAGDLLKIIEPKTCPTLSTIAKLLRKVSA